MKLLIAVGVAASVAATTIAATTYQPENGQPAAKADPDTTGAAIWAHLQVALNALRNGASRMPDGAIIVKENYMPNRQLAAITSMYKRRGYNSEHNDWFFTRHLPSGDLDKMEMNGMTMPMEGRLPGCQNCHLAKRDNDYLYTGELGHN
jgi:hypothetical protein